MKKAILFESNEGVRFERTDMKKRSRVVVRSGDYFIRDYRFNNTHGIEFSSPYVSWENLNCCGGWKYDKEYLKTAVQKGEKVCAGIPFGNAEEVDNYVGQIDKNKYLHIVKQWNNGPNKHYRVDIARKGTLNDFFDLESIGNFYELLGLSKYKNYVDIDRFNELFYTDVFDVISGNKNLDYGSPSKTIEENIITGLLLGYPLESTMAYMFNGINV